MAEAGTSPRTGAGKPDAARLLAFDVLRLVDDEDAYANLALARLLRERGVTGRDAAFATELVGGTLRMRRAYDAVLASLVDRALDPPVHDALRLGAHQLLSTRVPAHAAVGTTVSLVRNRVGHRPAGLVNAVLRRVSTRSLEDWMGHLDASSAVRASHPDWVVVALSEALGGGSGEPVEPLLRADNEPPRVTLVARPGLATREELPGTPLGITPWAVELESGNPGEVAAVREGRAAVQDAGSQLVALLLADAPVEGRDEGWLDLCAGPGGKAALLAALAAQRGAHLVANEPAPHRAELVRSALRVVPAGVAEVVAGDGRTPPVREGGFDRVLVDAPCSGLGALRRRPEARWRRSLDDLDELVPLQRALLDAALDVTRAGGVVGYVTCSPVVAETADVVRGVLAGRGDVLLEDAAALAPWVDATASRTLPGALQLWPHRHGTDAMFLALLRKT